MLCIRVVSLKSFAHLVATHFLTAACADPALPGSHRHPETPRHNVAATRQFMQQYSIFAASHGAATLQKQSWQASASLAPTPRAKPVQSAPLQQLGSQSSRDQQSWQASASLPPTPRAKPVHSAPLQQLGSQSSRDPVPAAHGRVRFAAADAGSTAQLQGGASLLAEAPAA